MLSLCNNLWLLLNIALHVLITKIKIKPGYFFFLFDIDRSELCLDFPKQSKGNLYTNTWTAYRIQQVISSCTDVILVITHLRSPKISMDLNVHERMHLLLPNILHVCKVIDISWYKFYIKWNSLVNATFTLSMVPWIDSHAIIDVLRYSQMEAIDKFHYHKGISLLELKI